MAGIWFCTDDSSSVSAMKAASYRGLPCSATVGQRRVAFDGTLYNRREVLSQLGYPPGDSRSDAGIVALAIEAWGRAALDRFDGPFAFVMRDDANGKILAARDRFGMRPLYLASSRSRIAFASEIKQFFAAGWLAATLNRETLLDYLVDGLTDHRIETMFLGVSQVPPAHLVELDLSDPAPRIAFDRWYSLPEAASLDLSDQEAIEGFRTRLIETVVRQWDQAERRGLCLSGGIDSSAIAVILSRYADGARDVFKASFANDAYDDWPLFHSVVDATGARSHVVTCTLAEALTAVDALVWHIDEPFSRASLAAQWYLFEEAANRNILAMLDGQGADEQLGGHTRMIAAHEEYLRGESGHESALRRVPRRPGAGTGYRWLAPSLRAEMTSRSEGHQASPRSLGVLCRERMHRGDLPMMMRHNDRIGMAHGIETHVPFLDHRLVEFSVALGDHHKYAAGTTKLLLRRALADLLPPMVVAHRGKASCSELEALWIRRDGDAFGSLALTKSRDWNEVFDKDGVAEISNDIPHADKESVLLLWRIIAFAAWAERFEVAM